MQQKNIIIGVIVLAVILAGIFYQMSQKSASNQNNNQTQNNNNQTTNTMDSNQNASGLKIETLAEGSGAEAKTGDMVTVNYTGTLTDGTKFDSSLNPGRTPFAFTIGPDCVKNNNCVIEGWNLGVTGMKVGEKRKLTIPPELGYGASGAGALIPPNATLIFEVELLKIN